MRPVGFLTSRRGPSEPGHELVSISRQTKGRIPTIVDGNAGERQAQIPAPSHGGRRALVVRRRHSHDLPWAEVQQARVVSGTTPEPTHPPLNSEPARVFLAT